MANVDTNQLVRLITVPPSDNITLLLATMIASNVMSLAGMILAYLTNSHVKAAKVEVTKIEHSVNSERTATLTKMDGLEKHITELRSELATAKERDRGQALKDAAAAMPPPPLTEARLIEILNARDKNR